MPDDLSPKAAKARVVAAFSRHWREVLERLRAGDDVAAARADCFLAGSDRARLRIARRFYGDDHAARLAALPERAVKRLLAPWLHMAVTDSLELGYSGDELEARLAAFVRSEYVMVVERHAGGRLVEPFPGEACYDDVYERTAGGCTVGGRVRLFKSTGEPFTPGEGRSAEAGLRRAFWEGYVEAGESEPWAVRPGEPDDPDDTREVVVWIEERLSPEDEG